MLLAEGSIDNSAGYAEYITFRLASRTKALIEEPRCFNVSIDETTFDISLLFADFQLPSAAQKHATASMTSTIRQNEFFISPRIYKMPEYKMADEILGLRLLRHAHRIAAASELKNASPPPSSMPPGWHCRLHAAPLRERRSSLR